MHFDIKVFNIILVIFQMKVTFQQIFFPNIVMFVWMKNLIQMFFVKSCEWNFSHGVEMVQLIHIQYMTMHFIKCCNYLNNSYNMFALCNTLVQVLNFHNFIIYSFILYIYIYMKITLFGSWTTLFWIYFMKFSFNIGLVEVESHIIVVTTFFDYYNVFSPFEQ